MLELVLGGMRSGKSLHAERLAASSGLEVHYIATAQAGDDEMRARIAQHRSSRPSGWRLHESPLALAETIEREASETRLLLVDCLTLWVSNQLMEAPERLEERSAALVAALAAAPGRIVVVSNEVGQGGVPMNALARRFVDLSGVLHQRIAERAERVWWVVAGLPQCFKGRPDA